ncbi:variant erythrocyte surface antigen-1 family protein [Babesia caballi]|uniref:Variant erythrocyte surface antigen-1 family protein n=1 Tax=Babesia caballi TaxID=5871 RepID=A0AAV4LP92_BABCB|nr:variant erythrocyte surface antigen-1 family protein [Babesia caballi]
MSGCRHNSLKDPFESLKEAVDWVLCMSGSDDKVGYHKGQEAIKKVAEQLKSLLSAVRVDSVDVKNLLNGDLNKNSLSYAPITALGLGLKHIIEEGNGMGKEYKYSYGDDNPSSNVDDNIAKIFLGMIPLLFFGLGFLFYMCHRGGGKWSGAKLSTGPFRVFLDTVGFHIEQLNGAKNGYNAVSSGLAMFSEFQIYESSPKTFTEYLKEVGNHTKSHLSSNPNDVPLGALYLFTFKYLKNQRYINSTTTDYGIPNSEGDVTSLLQKLRDAVDDVSGSSFSTLFHAYTQLIAAIDTAVNTIDAVEASSVVGLIGGTVVTAGMIGGGSAVYFNLGGAGTFLRGILRIP